MQRALYEYAEARGLTRTFDDKHADDTNGDD